MQRKSLKNSNNTRANMDTTHTHTHSLVASGLNSLSNYVMLTAASFSSARSFVRRTQRNVQICLFDVKIQTQENF